MALKVPSESPKIPQEDSQPKKRRIPLSPADIGEHKISGAKESWSRKVDDDTAINP